MKIEKNESYSCPNVCVDLNHRGDQVRVKSVFISSLYEIEEEATAQLDEIITQLQAIRDAVCESIGRR